MVDIGMVLGHFWGMKNQIECVCKVCGGKFMCQDSRVPQTIIYCSSACYYEDHLGEKVSILERGERNACDICGKVCEERHRRCSPACKAEANRRSVKAARDKARQATPARACVICGTESKLKYCSEPCRSVGHSRSIKAYQARVRVEKSQGKQAAGTLAGSAALLVRLRMLANEMKGLMGEVDQDLLAMELRLGRITTEESTAQAPSDAPALTVPAESAEPPPVSTALPPAP
jgi:hypothetical protein